jgi:hypothetical protein
MKRLLVLSLLLGGCASTTTLHTKPEGAIVMLNGAKVGETPYTLTDKDIVIGEKKLLVQKAGYKDATVTVKRDQWSTGRIILGICACGVPLLWAADYPADYTVELAPGKSGSADRRSGSGGK